MKPLQINQDVYWIGALHPELRVFDIIMQTPNGSTYNSYLIKDEKIAVIDTVKGQFTQEYMDNLSTLVNPADIDYIIVQHNEPDHSGSLAALLDVAKHAQVYCARPAMKYVTNIINREVAMTGVGANETLNLGKNTLTFIPAPFLHWPDTMMTWLENSNILFTCDVFATHFSDEALFSHLIKQDFRQDYKYYFDMIMRPFKKHVRNALAKIEPLDIKIIAPSHGPVLTADIAKYIQAYQKWSAPLPENTTPQVLVYYATAHGNTGVMAEKIAKGIRAGGANAEVFDACEINIDDHLDRIEAADILLFGSPTINNAVAKPVWDVLNSLVTIDTKGKTAASFGSMGWSGEAVPLLDERLKAMKFKVPFEGINAMLVPSGEELQKCFTFGQQLVESLKN